MAGGGGGRAEDCGSVDWASIAPMLRRQRPQGHAQRSAALERPRPNVRLLNGEVLPSAIKSAPCDAKSKIFTTPSWPTVDHQIRQRHEYFVAEPGAVKGA